MEIENSLFDLSFDLGKHIDAELSEVPVLAHLYIGCNGSHASSLIFQCEETSEQVFFHIFNALDGEQSLR